MPRRRDGSGSPWLLRLLTVLGVLLMLTAGGGLVLLNGLSSRFDAELTRADLLQGVPGSEGGGARNYLVLAADTRTLVEEPEPTGEPTPGPTPPATAPPTTAPPASGGEGPVGAETIMLLHITGDRSHAYVVVIPKDSHIEVPAGGTWPGGLTTINAAMSLGGPNLVARAVYDLTQVPLDGALIVDFAAISGMVEAVEGINVCTPFEVKSFFTDRTWAAGCHDLSPDEADEFVGPRALTPGGEVGRVINQQNVLMGVLTRAGTTDVLTSPTMLNAVMTRTAKALTVDDRLDVRELAFTLRGIGAANVRFTVVPSVGTVPTDAGPAVELDVPGAEALFTAVRDDTLDAWLAEHPLQLSAPATPAGGA
jgi:LCP family protein required for cell wall assembly